MAIDFSYLEKLADMGILDGNPRILDVGCSNLYSASAIGIDTFMKRFGASDRQFAERLASASSSKTAFAGELLTRCGMSYDAIDVAEDFQTTLFDLNRDRIPRLFRASFDLVLNFGTTEHVLNQAHAFSVIHDATKAGGHIVHQLPTSGFTSHGYFVYTGRFFFDLAGYNDYEVVAAWHDQAATSQLSKPFHDYATYFPVLADAPPPPVDDIPDSAATVIYRKKTQAPFVFPMETSTSYSTPVERTSGWFSRFIKFRR